MGARGAGTTPASSVASASPSGGGQQQLPLPQPQAPPSANSSSAATTPSSIISPEKKKLHRRKKSTHFDPSVRAAAVPPQPYHPKTPKRHVRNHSLPGTLPMISPISPRTPISTGLAPHSPMTPSTPLTPTAVLANKFVPQSLKSLNTSEVSATLLTGTVPTLSSESRRLFDALVPPQHVCLCPKADREDGSHHPMDHHVDVGQEDAMGLLRFSCEFRYGLHTGKPLDLLEDYATAHSERARQQEQQQGEQQRRHALHGSPTHRDDQSPKSDRSGESSLSQHTADTAARMAREEARLLAGRTGRVERERYEAEIGSEEVREAIMTPAHELTERMQHRNKFGGLLTLERDETLRHYEHLSQYKVAIQAFQASGGRDPEADKDHTYLYAHMVVPGIADVQPALAVGDACLVRPAEPLHMPKHQTKDAKSMVFDHSRNAYVPNPIEIQARVARIVRGRKSRSDEVVITWLSMSDDASLQHAWSFYPRDARRYNVRFVPRTNDHERCITALNWSTRLPAGMADSIILAKGNMAPFNLPKYQDGHRHHRAVGDRTLDMGQYNLNDSQKAFVSMLVSRTIHPSMDTVREPSVLTGPAGTGKTRSLFAAIDQVLSLDSDNRILVCAPSHTAANVLTERLGKIMGKHELLRLLDCDRDVETIPTSVLGFCKISESTGMFTFPALEELKAYRVIVCTCLDAHLLYRSGFTNWTMNTWTTCFKNYIESRIQQGGLRLDGTIAGPSTRTHFTHLFIDEAAQATEPETFIPLSVVVDPTPGVRKVEIALVGDPRQLGPRVYSITAAKHGLNMSYLERLLQRPNEVALAEETKSAIPQQIGSMEELMAYYNEERDETSVFLHLNYRSEPAFLMVPSALFYFDKLECALDRNSADPALTEYWCAKLRLLEAERVRVGLDDELAGDISADIPKMFRPFKQDHWPIHFRGVVGKDVSVALDNFSGTNSWSNTEEAKEVLEIVLNLVSNQVDPTTIGVMAAYRGQVVRIRRLLRKANLGIVNVGTVEDYQAVERKVIVLSLTRSTPEFVEYDIKRRAGVFQQPKMMNVALTRAEHLLIVVGNPDVMADCPIWRQFLWFCLRNGLWYGMEGGRPKAGLELDGEIVYSTMRPTGDTIDSNIAAVGTLERISRKSGADVDFGRLVGIGDSSRSGVISDVISDVIISPGSGDALELSLPPPGFRANSSG